MDFNDTKEEADFREEVKTWLKENASKGEKVGGRYDAIDVQEDALSRARDWQAKRLKLDMQRLHGQKSLAVLEVQQFNQLFILKKRLNIMFQQVFLKLVLECVFLQ